MKKRCRLSGTLGIWCFLVSQKPFFVRSRSFLALSVSFCVVVRVLFIMALH